VKILTLQLENHTLQVEILTAIKDSRKGIYEAQWEVAKLEMKFRTFLSALNVDA
jgi:hypothetical protein